MKFKLKAKNKKVTDGAGAQPEKTTKAKKGNAKIWLFAGVSVLVIVIVALLVVFLTKDNSGNDDLGTDGEYLPGFDISDEEKEVTKKVMDEYAEVEVVGFQEFEDENGKHNAIVVNVKNVSDKTVSLAIDVVAKNKEGTILEKSSLYAEGIMPGQTQVFNTFVYSALSADELKSADYEIFKAYTYVAPGTATNEESQSEAIVEQTTEGQTTEEQTTEEQSETNTEQTTEE